MFNSSPEVTKLVSDKAVTRTQADSTAHTHNCYAHCLSVAQCPSHLLGTLQCGEDTMNIGGAPLIFICNSLPSEVYVA